MEIFVKGELPKNCWNCPCFRNDLEQSCGLDDENKDYFLDEIDGGECPLKSLSEHDAAICKKIKQGINDKGIVSPNCADGSCDICINECALDDVFEDATKETTDGE